jgi:hypothetical protein
MENRNNILNELREISPVVAGISHQVPYSVPAGYFEELAGRLLQLVKAGEAGNPVLPKPNNPYQVPQGYFEVLASTILQRVIVEETSTPVLPKTNNPYQVPQGYFEGLANTILQRVKADDNESLSPALQQANNNPYQVPQGYFEGLASTILQRVKAEEASTPVLPKTNNPYQVPQGYFEGLASTILQRVKADDNESLSPALQQANNNPYQVPQGYFDNLPAAILNRVKATAADNATEELEILSPVLSQIGKQMPFNTPAGYFDELGENAIEGAQAIDFVNGALENLSPIMNSLKSVQVYEVPAGYFEQLPGQVLQVAKAQQPAKVVSMSFTRRVIRYAAAAVVAGLIITAGWFYLGKSDKIIDKPEVAAAELDSISDEMLEKYLENQTAAPAETAIAATPAVDDLSANDMKDMLADVTDADLQQYLEKYSTVKDIQTN